MSNGGLNWDRELHLGYRRQSPARPLRARQVPRRDPADDRAAPPRRRAAEQQAGGLRHEGRPRRRRVVEQDAALRQAAGQRFYNTSRFTLSDLRARANRQQLTADFQA